MLASLLLALVAWPQDRSQATERDDEGRKTPLHISTQRGRLSVDLRDADAREVLTQIGREAGLSITGDPPAEKRLTAPLAAAGPGWGPRRPPRPVCGRHGILSDRRGAARRGGEG